MRIEMPENLFAAIVNDYLSESARLAAEQAASGSGTAADDMAPIIESYIKDKYREHLSRFDFSDWKAFFSGANPILHDSVLFPAGGQDARIEADAQAFTRLVIEELMQGCTDDSAIYVTKQFELLDTEMTRLSASTQVSNLEQQVVLEKLANEMSYEALEQIQIFVEINWYRQQLEQQEAAAEDKGNKRLAEASDEASKAVIRAEVTHQIETIRETKRRFNADIERRGITTKSLDAKQHRFYKGLNAMSGNQLQNFMELLQQRRAEEAAEEKRVRDNIARALNTLDKCSAALFQNNDDTALLLFHLNEYIHQLKIITSVYDAERTGIETQIKTLEEKLISQHDADNETKTQWRLELSENYNKLRQCYKKFTTTYSKTTNAHACRKSALMRQANHPRNRKKVIVQSIINVVMMLPNLITYIPRAVFASKVRFCMQWTQLDKRTNTRQVLDNTTINTRFSRTQKTVERLKQAKTNARARKGADGGPGRYSQAESTIAQCKSVIKQLERSHSTTETERRWAYSTA